jgi:transketolase
MRKEFVNSILRICQNNNDIVFLTGDLGFMAFEGLKEVLGSRFINMGVAEQNMISVAAGLAKEGFSVFCYSIAPFIVYRCLEQTRNDVCLHELPVFLVGNGGGYGYGIMGSSHHAIEDLACLQVMPNLTCYVPGSINDMNTSINQLFYSKKPAYLRLGVRGSLNYAPNNVDSNDFCVISNQNPKTVIIALGPIVQNAISSLTTLTSNTTNIYVINKLPLSLLSKDCLKDINNCQHLIILEEHVMDCGLGQSILYYLYINRIIVKKVSHRYAVRYLNKQYGNQDFHLKQSGLDIDSIRQTNT